MHPARLALALAVLCSLAAPAGAQAPLKLFDAHLHYNWEPTPHYPLDKVLEIFRRNGVEGILATSRPNDGTQALVEAKADGLWVVPFIRPYRTRADIQTWHSDPAIYELIEREYRRGYYRGIGEFHIYGEAAAGPLVKQIVAFAVERNLWLHAHCDETALLHLLSHDPRAKIVWAHTGFSVPAARVAELMDTHPALMGELSYRAGIAERDGTVTPEWRALFDRHSDRFLIGSDTWINERWVVYDGIVAEYRRWLASLPPDQAARIAHGNAERIFGRRAGP